MAPAQPELKKVGDLYWSTLLPDFDSPNLLQYLDKRLFVQLNGSRKVIGILRGYDVNALPARYASHATRSNLR